MFDSTDINTNLSALREAIRSGSVTVNPANFRREIASRFGINPEDFNTENFRTKTLERFARLFKVPVVQNAPPTQDNYAWALTNFINRRSEPWAFLSSVSERPTNEATAAAADPAAFDVVG